ncbi:MAG: leucine-rich repeat domain-containing protein [Clostridia bacterium]|nr:leucine-rich repeat domain-containing protein [Clostridia bacterium]
MKKNNTTIFLLCLLTLLTFLVIFCACDKKEETTIIDDIICEEYLDIDNIGVDLTTYTFPENIQVLKFEDFVNSTGAVDLVIPESVVDIEMRAFYNSEIVSLTFNSNPRLMDNLKDCLEAFKKCENLKKVVFPAMANVASGMFGGCKNLEEVDFVFFGSVGAGAFRDCEKLQNFDFAKCYTVGDGAFNKIAEVYLPSAQEILANSKSSGYNPFSMSEEEYADRSDQQKFMDIMYSRRNSRPFRENAVLEKITFAEDYTEIEPFMFYKCSSLETVVFEGNKIYRIRNNAFLLCENLKNISFGSYMRIIEEGAFGLCKSLTEIILPEGLTEIQLYAFSGCEKLKELHLPSTASKFGNCGSSEEIGVIASDYTKIIVGENTYWSSYEKRDEHDYI